MMKEEGFRFVNLRCYRGYVVITLHDLSNRPNDAYGTLSCYTVVSVIQLTLIVHPNKR
jgi:hypothetical protein